MLRRHLRRQYLQLNLRNLKGKKKLYVRVKVYKKVNGKTVASQWSKATKIRLKK
ncbi:MAG: hypothetical protein ACLUR5_18285 [Eubacterium ventriosum]